VPDRLGLEYSKPERIGKRLDAKKPQAFIEAYEDLLNSLGPDEAVLFMEAVRPTHHRRYAAYPEFAEASLPFLCEEVPKDWPKFSKSVTDKFRVIYPKGFSNSGVTEVYDASKVGYEPFEELSNEEF